MKSVPELHLSVRLLARLEVQFEFDLIRNQEYLSTIGNIGEGLILSMSWTCLSSHDHLLGAAGGCHGLRMLYIAVMYFLVPHCRS